MPLVTVLEYVPSFLQKYSHFYHFFRFYEVLLHDDPKIFQLIVVLGYLEDYNTLV